ncbi:MAG: efflux RND transporter periplasmic adaptor subunit [Planctomycetales bacterium]|nr:efflux RND transporter periplasmic adaptor subunit [Planctomycetales bacterium]MCA9192737.1 efflux RND transporter periplasmic adaptor subunit [Planctomycetales bacterium]
MKRFIAAILFLGFAIASGVYILSFQNSATSTQELVYYQVNRADLPIVVTERGHLESQEQTSIRCMVDTYDRSSGTSGTSIISIVPNGSLVQKGDILIELDSASIRDYLDSEALELESDRSSLRQAEARKKNRITQNETALAHAKLELELAELNRKMYVDEESGAFKLSLSEIERQVDESRNAILEAQAALKLQETEKDGIEQLFRLGYKGRSDLEQSRYAFLKSEAALAAAVNKLANIEASKKQLETYTRQMELMKLDGEVETARRNLKQVQVTNESELAQVEAQLFEAKERVDRQESRIAHYEQQLRFCTIQAPHDGMVVYAQDSRGSTSVGVGQDVRTRQELVTLPDLSRMQVRLQIHEAVLDQVHRGLPVSISVDAFPNTSYQGIVEHVAVVPTSTSRTVKTYECIVLIPGTVDKLKPGMTAVAEIHIDRLRDVISVPVQAVVQLEQETWCYVSSNNGPGVEKKLIELGRNNDKFVEIIDGVSEADRVVLNPLVIASLENRNRENQISPDAGSKPPVDDDGEAAALVKVQVSDREPNDNAT